MKESASERMRLYVLIAIVMVAIGGQLGFSSCTPDSEISAAESDVVVTVFNDDVDFSALTTFAVIDSILHLTADSTLANDPNISRSNDQEIITAITQQFTDLGYTEESDPANNAVDFVVFLGATSTDNFFAYLYYPWWPGYGYWPGWGYCPGCWGPGWGWGYPPTVNVGYAYSTGTLLTLMVNPDTTGVSGKKISPVLWIGAINGVLNDSDSSIQQRLETDIPQMFIQSPYLGK